MEDGKDPGIEPFGRQIPLSDAEASDSALPSSSEIGYTENPGEQEEEEEEEENEDDDGEETAKDYPLSEEQCIESMQQEDGPGTVSKKSAKHEALLDSENPKTPSLDEEMAKPRAPSAQKEQTCKSSSEEKQKDLKKPDKILLCPRCNSMDTKFCYYNNYNVNQPRHFCKSCQRYWTSGGTMRNVPVGAGRRKNKGSASHNYRSEALQEARIHSPNGTRGIPSLNGSGNVLSFNANAPIYNPATSLHGSEDTGRSNCSSGSPVIIPNSADEETGTCQMEQKPMSNLNGFIPQVPCLSWPYFAAVPGIFPLGLGIPYYAPVDFWNCTGSHDSWTFPWLFPRGEKVQCSVSNSPTLGKHSREEDELQKKEKNGCVLVPKTLRVNDPTEAAKSTIWATLGIKNDHRSGTAGGLFKAFQTKGSHKSEVPETSRVLCANPAALSRSIKFHESS
ncbi:hypothetical protein SAY86_006701 [Trapa natans]|uniref:Dof-type domain-containing protein n=1 Tax=Trapa natans TaxID=22666 RepID=A0AAN7KZB4_TRANT|nr:hypothetical protein SAY86_006701 [Trapa natans]